VLSVVLFFHDMMDRADEGMWEDVVAHELLRPEDERFLRQLTKEQRCTVLIHWSAEVAKLGVAKAKAEKNVVKGLVDKLLKVRWQQQEVADTLNLPMPFQYFHLLNVMICMNLLLWAYGMGITDSIFAPLVYYFCALIFMGMMELGSQLANPFGDDAVDFPVKAWLAELVELVGLLLDYGNLGAANEWEAPLESKAKFHHCLRQSELLTSVGSCSSSSPPTARELIGRDGDVKFTPLHCSTSVVYA